MHEIDAQTLLEQASLIGLISRDQAKAVRADAEDGSIEAVTRVLLRRDLLTAWQVEKFKKGDLSGFIFGGCKVLFHIAEGTFARVYRGRKMAGNQSVAIKVLRQRFVADPAAIARFNQEAESGMRLVHPNIVQTYEYGEQDKKYYMIMEFVEGSNLRDFLRIRGRLTPEEALPLMMGLAKGLAFSLDKGVTHRDLKASNILISSSGEAKLVDFGLATIEGEEKKMAAAHGQRTVDYSALERTCGSPKGDKRSDIFFLGCVFYQMITGVLPMPEVETNDPLKKMLKRGINTIKPLSDQRHAPDEGLSRIIEKMMKVDLKARYQTMEQVVSDLDDYLEQLAAKSHGGQAKRSMPGPGSAAPAAAAAVEHVDEVHGPEDAGELGGEVKRLLCVEAQSEVQDALRKYLTRMGYRVLIVSSPELAVERFRENPTDGVVFDADGLGPEALDAFLSIHEKAREDGHDLSAVVLLGPRQHFLAKRLPTNKRLVVLPKPLKMKQIQDAIQKLVPIA
ncbi:protein kinase domain-containing protein [Tundrisphaera sp. TA3]|uniref:protein kinase domain-containing protein n=1 Tax=Tundrisphaera sp. TA3 TaxID=3435775 RepID=UPI003EBF10E3